MNKPRKRLLTFNDPQPLRIDRRLAMEIGFLESVVLLQLEFLISISHNEREGQFWTYHTLKELKEKHFPWLSQATICRTIQSLEEKGLIVRGHFNRSGFDRTQWFALNYEGIANLASIRVGEDAPILHNATPTLHTETPVLQDAIRAFHPERSVLQDEATLPESPSETSQRDTNHSSQPVHKTVNSGEADREAVVVALCESLTNIGVTRKKAEALVRDYPSDKIQEQIAMLGYRNADDPAAVLVRAIEEDWAPPVEFRRAVNERRKHERQRLHREQMAREQAEQTAAEEARQAAEDEWWCTQSVEEQAALQAEAEASLRAKRPFLFGNGGPKKTGVMYRSMLDVERRRLIRERMTRVA